MVESEVDRIITKLLEVRNNKQTVKTVILSEADIRLLIVKSREVFIQ